MLDNIIGQAKAKETISVLINSVKSLGGPMPHTLFTGPAGVGKSTLARSIAKELGVHFIEVNSACTGTATETRVKLIISLEDMKENTIMFLDECHRLSKNSQELLYTAIEDGYISYGEYLGGKVKVKPFTLLGATTDLSCLTRSMQTRFNYVITLEEYNRTEIAQIINAEAIKKGFSLDANLLSEYCRGNPRVAKNYLDWIYRYCSTKNVSPTHDVIKHAMEREGVYAYGLGYDDLRYIELLKRNKVMGVRSIAHTLNIPEKTVKESIEPYLLKLRLINIVVSLQNKRSINKQRVLDLGL